ncbi:MAG: GntR family transcriptional regulator [Candidatus Omnitrophica bacterium]|nr:GntR family transcriptional regulator [Candidatus Omnitrophota bacterium]MBU1997665.1 GntR family transcriptional regulator [Candidatus Omnitrophota bacterium]
MINFSIKFQSGVPIYEQIIYAVKKAVVSEQLRPGDTFPSVRELSKDLRINPNTAQKVIAHLVREKLLIIKPGIGSVVSELKEATDLQRKDILDTEIEKLVVEAKRLLINKKEVIDAVKSHWNLENEE